MSRIIADLYEIQRKIGAGGGGVVYLGEHIRLKKPIVLKADKRTLSTPEASLRREVDLLKGLTHTYMPTVYDFVQQDGVVYTVMDYIEGESLDKLLARKELPSQPDIIKWSCQLLEALKYLHSQGEHGILHGDIKPANIMLRPSGSICLIDFNIALALGEDGAVKVGFSRGYASPEHYGADYINGQKPAAVGISFPDNKRLAEDDKTEVDEDRTLVEDEDKTLVEEEQKEVHTLVSVWKTGTTASGRGSVLLDVRSDIYSLGATLYHLISGVRPAQDAREVLPLHPDVCSPAVAEIIQKAMAVEPENRYQSAEEMLNAFLTIHINDKRVIRHKRRMKLTVAILAVIFLSGGACAFTGMKQLEQRQTAFTLAEYSANALAEGDRTTAVKLALEALPTGKSIFEIPVTAEAQMALTNALGVYDLSDGFHAADAINLPSAPFGIAVSPEETYLAAIYGYEAAIYDMKTRETVAVLPIQQSALSDVVFVDDKTIIYAGDTGVTVYDVENAVTLWTGEPATTITVSADGKVAAAIDRDAEETIIYRVADGTVITKLSFNGLHLSVAANDIFADPEDDIFSLNADGSLLAVSFSNGALTIFDIAETENSLLVFENSDYKQFEGGFCGKYFAYAANTAGKAEFGLIDTAEAVCLGGYGGQDAFSLKTDEEGIYLANGNLLVEFSPDTLQETELAYTENLQITNFAVGKDYVLVAMNDNGFSFYDSGANLMSTESSKENCDFVELSDSYAVIANRNEPTVRMLKLENQEETQLLSYDARYIHEEARVAFDGRTVMLFDYEHFCIYDMQGSLTEEAVLPDAEQIYDQQFRKSEAGSWLEVIWYDGTRRCYSAVDGSLISEKQREPPAKDLCEEFYTENYRIASSLHRAPEVYEIASGKLVATLEEDSYLTYVTETGNYIITEYISADGERFGILLDSNLQKLAYLPNLCDVNGEMLVFDYASGNLRQVRIASLEELKELGQEYLENE